MKSEGIDILRGFSVAMEKVKESVYAELSDSDKRRDDVDFVVEDKINRMSRIHFFDSIRASIEFLEQTNEQNINAAESMLDIPDREELRSISNRKNRSLYEHIYSLKDQLDEKYKIISCFAKEREQLENENINISKPFNDEDMRSYNHQIRSLMVSCNSFINEVNLVKEENEHLKIKLSERKEIINYLLNRKELRKFVFIARPHGSNIESVILEIIRGKRNDEC